MSSKVCSIGLSKHEKMIEYHVDIGSKDQYKRVGVRQKMTEMRSIVEDHRI